MAIRYLCNPPPVSISLTMSLIKTNTWLQKSSEMQAKFYSAGSQVDHKRKNLNNAKIRSGCDLALNLLIILYHVAIY